MLFSILESLGQDGLNDVLVTSTATLKSLEEAKEEELTNSSVARCNYNVESVDFRIAARKAIMSKCPRCWKCCSTGPSILCSRCQKSIDHMQSIKSQS
jgi:hypothetical protein